MDAASPGLPPHHPPVLTDRDIEEDDALPHPSIYNRRFGSFKAAKDAAGID